MTYAAELEAGLHGDGVTLSSAGVLSVGEVSSLHSVDRRVVTLQLYLIVTGCNDRGVTMVTMGCTVCAMLN